MCSALDAVEATCRLEMLGRVALPSAIKYLVTGGKFDTGQLAKSFNVETGYPAEPALLQTLSRWAEIAGPDDLRFRNGYDLHCLRRLLERNDKFDYAVILYDVAAFNHRYLELLSTMEGRSFLTFGQEGDEVAATPNVIFDLRDERTFTMLELAWDLFATGAVYGISPYGLDDALEAVARSQRLSDTFRARTTHNPTSVTASVY
jgi:hypothetical protein